MISELFIEGYRADISTEISSLLTFAIDDIKDFASRQTAFSKAITLPGTSVNNGLFGFIFEAGSSNDYSSSLDNIGYNFNAAKSARCIVFQDNIQTFKGSLRLLQINKDRGNIEYEVALTGELTNLNVALSSGYLEDLDFSAYDTVFNYTNIVNSWDNPGGSDVYFPLIDYGTYSSLKADWDVKTFRPALYVKEYIDKMFTAAGYRYSSALFSTARFEGLIVPHNQKKLTVSRTQLMEATITSTKVNPVDIAWDAITGTDFTLTTSNKHITYNTVASVSGTIHVDVVATFIKEDITFTFKKNGSTIYTQTRAYNGSGSTNFISFNADIAASFNTTDYISCTVSIANTTAGNTHSVQLCTVRFDSTSPQLVEVSYGDTITVNDSIPKNIRQVDFLLSIVRLFNLYVYESLFDDKMIYIEPFVDFYSTDSRNAVDWTYKMNRDAVQTIKPLSEVTSKTYKFKYKDDSDYYNDLYKKRYNEGYGSYTFDSEFEFASQENSLELIFAPTPLVGYSGEDKVFSTIFKLTNGTEENIDSVIRILQTKKVTGVSSWDIKNGATVLTSVTKYGYAGHFDDPDAPSNDLNFGALNELFFTLVTGDLSGTQFNIYWSSYMAEITDKDSKMLTAKFYLTPKDIFDLDFSKYVYVDGVLYRLNKITDYNITIPGDCEVQLLRVLNTIY